MRLNLSSIRNSNELKVLALGIPAVSLVATTYACVEHGAQFFHQFVFSLGFTTVIWIGAMAIFRFASRRFPSLEQTKKRIVLTGLAIALWVLLVRLVVCTAIALTEGLDINKFWTLVVSGMLTSYLLTLVVSLFYEGFYLFRKLVEAQRQADQLAQENLLAQLSRLKTQIQPHFLFNNFNTLAAVIEENPPLASEMVQELAGFYRYLLSATDKDMVAVEEELDCLKAYAFLLKMRHGDDFTLELNVDPAALNRLVPALSLQMLVENAVKHTALGPDQPLVVRITIDEATVRIENVLRPRRQPLPSTGVGLENLRMRLLLAGLSEPEVRRDNGQFSVQFPILSPAREVVHAR